VANAFGHLDVVRVVGGEIVAGRTSH